MSLNDTSCCVKYNGDGTSVNFPFYFDAIDSSWLAVYVDKVKQDASKYSVVLNGGTTAGGRVQFSSAPESGKKIVIVRDVPFSQLTSYPNFSAISAESIEKSYDKLTAITQQVRNDIDRCLKADIGESAEDYWVTVKAQMNYAVQNATNSAMSAAYCASDAATAALFTGNCMTEITGQTIYAEQAAAIWANVETSVGAIVTAGTLTLIEAKNGCLSEVGSAASAAAGTITQESNEAVRIISGSTTYFLGQVQRAEGALEVVCAGCTAAEVSAGTSSASAAANASAVATLKNQFDAQMTAALAAGTVCVINAGTSASAASTACQQALVALQGCTAAKGDALDAAADALAQAVAAGTSATAAYAAELAAGTVAEQTANSCITVHNASALAHQDIRTSVSNVNATVNAHSVSINTLEATVAANLVHELRGEDVTDTVITGGTFAFETQYGYQSAVKVSATFTYPSGYGAVGIAISPPPSYTEWTLVTLSTSYAGNFSDVVDCIVPALWHFQFVGSNAGLQVTGRTVSVLKLQAKA